ncbi:hypothetical protein GCM10012288_09910 [Malaciobacter pacificus]|uniref:Uncharacterized protein n=1 Tax=Malaciobacter pacificus TaxID=1080223 RepID=A0A5C2HB22_9BACT|nr:hypothetical protein [Malaciobacter pacificus]QEP34396.1 hypothetical protein APAC_1277 [Malaciobacter pacificus]GGD37845.1 hypothetical protein GCM10012288_09910 [Malaciobacter pacificus]
MKNILKIVFLGVVGFGLLVYFTAPKNPNPVKKNYSKGDITLDSFPRFFDVVSKGEYTKFQDLFTGGKQYLVVLNHDGLAVFKDLHKYTNKDIILVANIVNTPWLIQKLAVDGKLEELFKDSKIPLINDSKGLIANILDIKDRNQNSYIVYEINDKNINKLFTSKVKLNALQDGVTQEEIKNSIEEFLEKL